MKDFLSDLWSRLVWRLYKTTNRFIDECMCEVFLSDLLDHMGAPTHRKGIKSPLNNYGRLLEYCEEQGIAEEATKPL